MPSYPHFLVLSLVLLGPAAERAVAASPESTILWCTADRLMPGWGLYPNAATYGGTKSLGHSAAWGKGRLTWVAEFPRAGSYHFWVRVYGGYGGTAVTLDDRPLAGIKKGPGGARYVWRHAGQLETTAGPHHLDCEISGMFDAVLLTADPDLAPKDDGLPPPLEKPQLHAPRRYRSDAALGRHAQNGYLISAAAPYTDYLNDEVPGEASLVDKLQAWGAAGQYLTASFNVRALDPVGPLTVTLDELCGPQAKKIDSSQIDLRVVHLRRRTLSLFRAGAKGQLCPDLLVRDDQAGWPPKGQQGGYGNGHCLAHLTAHQSRQIWATVYVSPGSPPGTYRGTIRLARGEKMIRTLPLALEILPIDLKPVEGYYALYHRAQPVDPKREYYVSPERYQAELADQVRHGVNGATLYGGFASLEHARAAGITQPPVIMGWPSSAAPQQVEQAKALGFSDLYYYGVDEPHGPAIERCRREGLRRHKLGLHMFTAINSRAAWEAVKDVVDRPVYNLFVFDATTGTAADARQRGFLPISYWTTAVSYPLYYRALTGLYNTASGYLGTAPWAYADYTDQRLFADEPQHIHAVSYPDEAGNPIPTLRFAAFREGVDDVRYLQALDRAIAAAESRLKTAGSPAGVAESLAAARRVRAERFEPLAKKRWLEYLKELDGDALAQTRRQIADAVVDLGRHLR